MASEEPGNSSLWAKCHWKVYQVGGLCVCGSESAHPTPSWAGGTGLNCSATYPRSHHSGGLEGVTPRCTTLPYKLFQAENDQGPKDLGRN